ncbi:MAG TPA: hypothetical protein VMI54_31060 [Polyangiaceae bacterium]|nr:hypothetical protein [Polyangiaceae bacterium]
MQWRRGLWTLGLGVCSLGAAGCSGGDDKSKCAEPTIDGSPFSLTGTATVHGTGTLPAGSPDGYELDLMIGDQDAQYGVLPPNLLDASYVCGQTFGYTIHQVPAGTYQLFYALYANNAMEPSAMGPSTQSFTVADGQDLEFDATF